MSEQGSTLKEDAVRDAFPAYSVKAEMASTEDMPPGYKRTNVGVIPKDWEILDLLSAANFFHGRAHEPYVSEIGDFIVVNSKFVSSEGKVKKFCSKNLTPAQAGDVLMVLSDLPKGQALAKCCYVSKDNLYAVNQRVCIFRTKNTDSKYLFYKLNRSSYFLSFDDGVNQTHILNRDIMGCEIAIPPTSKEQRAIATALSDADALIASLDRLIAKKRAIKQAAMQQLLTGQIRLPGFTSEWETKRLGEIGRFRGGSGFPTVFQGETSGQYPYFKVSDMNNEGNETFMESASNYVNETTRKQLGAIAFPAKSIVFAKVGAAIFLERKKILSKSSCLDNNMAAFILEDGVADCRFMHFVLLNMPLGNLVSTTALPSLNSKLLAGIECRLPSLTEQQAIATALSDMDTEIEALEHRRDKAHQIKQGMMQQLLTGRVRLVEPELSAETNA